MPSRSTLIYTPKYRILLNTLENSSPPCGVAVKSYGNSAVLRNNWILYLFYRTLQVSCLWAWDYSSAIVSLSVLLRL